MKYGITDNDMVTYHCYKCEQCENVYQSKKGLDNHMETKHVKSTLKSAMKNKSKYPSDKHEAIIKEIEGELTEEKVLTELNTLMNSSPSRRQKKMINVMRNIANLKVSCESCDKNTSKDRVRTHADDKHEINQTGTIFLSHHEEDNLDECQIEMKPFVWELFLCEDEVKTLTEEEKKELLKLHKYFAHRNASKLWENLLQPAGRLKGKKKLVIEFLEKCEICRKY